jgi:c-di-GMP-binding flagellar brake protein YcgR
VTSSDRRERRTNPRFVCELMTFLHPEDAEPIAGESADLGMGGLAARIDRELVVESRIQVLLTLSLGWSETDFLRIPAKVVWCRHEGDAYVVGVQFDEIDEAERRRLEVLVRVLGGALDSIRAQV